MKAVSILSIFLSLNVFAQGKFHTQSSFDLLFVSKSLQTNELSNDLNSFKNIQLGNPVNYSGISLTSGFLVNRKSRSEGGYVLDGYYEYLYLIPQKVLIHDSLDAKIKGFNIGVTLAGIDLIRSKTFDLITSFGLNFGRVWLDGPTEIKQKNPYFSPTISIMPRICLNRISVQVRASYDYDISNKNWKRKGVKDTELIDLNGFKYQGLNLVFGVGYILK